NRVGAVPQRDGEAQVLPIVADARDAVLAPAVGARTRVVVRQVFPRRAVGAVVLAYGAPLPLAHVRAPAPPRRLPGARFGEPRLFGGHFDFSRGHRGARRGSIDQWRYPRLPASRRRTGSWSTSRRSSALSSSASP